MCFQYTGQAQITRAARIDLSSLQQRYYLGPQIQMTVDKDKRLAPSNIMMRHRNQKTGEILDSRHLNFGLGAPATWLSFSVTNNSNEEDWMLDFGTFANGRFAKLKALHVFNYERGETFIDADSTTELQRALSGSNAISIKITPQKTEFIGIYLETSPDLPAKFTPSLVSSQAWENSRNQGKTRSLVIFFSLIFSGFFVAISLLKSKPNYLIYSLYPLLPIALFETLSSLNLSMLSFAKMPYVALGLQSLFGLAILKDFFGINKEYQRTQAVIFFVGAIVLLATVLLLIPMGGLIGLQSFIFLSAIITAFLTCIILSLTQFKHQKYGSLPFAVSFAFSLAGLFISFVSLTLLQNQGGFLPLMYLYSTIPHLICLVAAVTEKVKRENDDTLNALARRNRSAQALSRLQESKDAADQARLLRVINRERELMAELREKEAQRTEEMRRAKDEADNANAAKSAFLAVISHEIRTPMNGIMGILKLMQDTNLTKEQADFILTMQKTGDTMVALLNDILDFEKIETGKMELEHINIDLHNMAKGIVTLMSGYVVGKEVKLLSDIGPNVPRYVLCDPTRLRQVLLNLMSNAIKFTDNGSVTIQLRAEKLIDKPASVKGDYEVTFAIVDTGVGIPEEAQITLFEPFQQADKSIARKYGGSGLGLAISMRLVEIMGSAIRLESKVDEGSKFFFSLLMEEGYGEESDTIIDSDQSETDGKASISPLKTLVIEDNEINRKVLQSFLEKDNHNVTLTESGEDGLRALDSDVFDVVFMDINLPGISGLETAKIIRQSDRTDFKKLPLIAITGNLMPQDLDNIRDAGINDFVGKPIDYNKIQDILCDIHDDKFDEIDPDILDRLQEEKVATEKQEQPVQVQTQPEITKEPDLYGSQNLLNEETANTIEEQPVEDVADEQIIDTSDLADGAIDYSILEGLLETLGPDTLKELIDGCLDKTEEIIETMEDEEARQNVDFMRARMHELKGMSYNFGLKQIGDVAKIGENAAKEEVTNEVLQAAETLSTIKKAARAALYEWLDTKKN